jgi:hypothetical protein
VEAEAHQVVEVFKKLVTTSAFDSNESLTPDKSQATADLIILEVFKNGQISSEILKDTLSVSLSFLFFTLSEC